MIEDVSLKENAIAALCQGFQFNKSKYLSIKFLQN